MTNFLIFLHLFTTSRMKVLERLPNPLINQFHPEPSFMTLSAHHLETGLNWGGDAACLSAADVQRHGGEKWRTRVWHRDGIKAEWCMGGLKKEKKKEWREGGKEEKPDRLTGGSAGKDEVRREGRVGKVNSEGRDGGDGGRDTIGLSNRQQRRWVHGGQRGVRGIQSINTLPTVCPLMHDEPMGDKADVHLWHQHHRQ